MTTGNIEIINTKSKIITNYCRNPTKYKMKHTIQAKLHENLTAIKMWNSLK